MSANMVRFGGIACFLLIIIALVGGFISGGDPTIAMIISVINTLLFLFILWSTKGFFNAKSYAKADIFILLIMAALVVLFILGLIGGGGLGAITSPAAAGAAGALGIVSLIVALVMFVCFIIFALRSMDFGNIGGGIWKALGILLLIALICFIIGVAIEIIAVLAQSLGLSGVMGILVLVGGLVFLAALVVWGIALMMGAGKMGTA